MPSTSDRILRRYKKALKRISFDLVAATTYFTSYAKRRRARSTQSLYLRKIDLQSKERVIVFFMNDLQKVTGGRLQIYAMYNLACELFRDTSTGVVMCWLPGEGRDIFEITTHSNDVIISPFSTVLETCRNDCELILHVPEYCANHFVEELVGWKWLINRAKTSELHLNVMNFNIDRMVNRNFFTSLRNHGIYTTIITSGDEWASPREQDRMGVPLHWVPIWYSPDGCPWQPYETKENLMIISPDFCKDRESVINAIKEGVPKLSIKVINDIPYDEYVQLEKKAKWSLTFGEGCDGYFYGVVRRGGIAFAVQNHTFSGIDTARWYSLFDSYEDMASKIAATIQSLDAKDRYEEYNQILRPVFMKNSGLKVLGLQMQRFYSKDYRLAPCHYQDPDVDMQNASSVI